MCALDPRAASTAAEQLPLSEVTPSLIGTPCCSVRGRHEYWPACIIPITPFFDSMELANPLGAFLEAQSCVHRASLTDCASGDLF